MRVGTLKREMSSRKRPPAADRKRDAESIPPVAKERKCLSSLLHELYEHDMGLDIQKKVGGSTADVSATAVLLPQSEHLQVHQRPSIGPWRSGQEHVDRKAVLSACGMYRYQLTRQVKSSGRMFGFVGVNPSTADASVEDHTTRKWLGFVKRWGGKGYQTVNLFAFRATDVKELANVTDPVGVENDCYIDELIYTCDVLVPCWGSLVKLPAQHRRRAIDVLIKLQASGKPINHLGLTKDGQPKHPLLLPYDTKLRDFSTFGIYARAATATHGQRRSHVCQGLVLPS